MPQIFVVFAGSDQPSRIDQPAASKKLCVFIVAAGTGASDGWVPPWSLIEPIGSRPSVPVRPLSQ